MAMTGFSASIVDLRVNGLVEPLAVDTERPVFSWRMESGRIGARQCSYRIVMKNKEDVIWDSGAVVSAASVGIVYPEDVSPLTPESRYDWSVEVTDESGAALTASSYFATGFMNGALSAWHGASWIGGDEMNVAAETIPVFRLTFTIQIREGGSAAGVVFGANDPRLLSSIHNNYLIHGENYIAYRLKAATIPASVEIVRKGYTTGETEETLLTSIPVPESLVNEANRFSPHDVEIAITGHQMAYMTIDGEKLITHPDAAKESEKTAFILNPLNVDKDAPLFPRLCQIGFTTDEATKAVFTDYAVRYFGGDHVVFFGEKVGATYSIFKGLAGLAADGAAITAAPGTLAFADPTFGAVPMLRKAFTIDKPVASALLYSTARGICDITINGKSIANEYLSPGDTDFRQHILYEAHDVTGLLTEGGNAIGATLASGWYGDQTSYMFEKYNYYGDQQALLALLAVTYADGSVDYIPTDDTWQYYGDGPIRYAANFNGETYDARKEAAIDGWDTSAYDASAWRTATVFSSKVCGCEPVITAKIDPPTKEVETVTAVFISKEVRGDDQDTVYIYDMGKNIVGFPEIIFPAGEAGRHITIRYAEMLYPRLAEDNPYYYGELGGLILTENLRGALVTDHYITKGYGVERFRPTLTFHGWRYVEISGIDEAIPAENIKGTFISSVVTTSRYRSSNPLTNQLFKNIVSSTLANHISIPTDCPQRDERLGWAGDARVYCETAVYMADMSSFYRSYARMLRDAQDKEGTFHLYAPTYEPIGEAFALGYTWNAAGSAIPYETYRQYGDVTAIAEQYEAMRLHAEGMMGMIAEGKQFLTSHIGFLGDHLAVVPTEPSLMDNAQYYQVLRFTEDAARVLGYAEDAAKFGAFADGLKREWNETYIDENGRTRGLDGSVQDTQASYALPLMCGVFDAKNEAPARKRLVELIHAEGDAMTTGFMGTGPLLPALTEGGEIESAYTLFERTEHPSWLYPVVNGATSIWERWSSYTIENGFGGQNWMNSFNHYSLGAVGKWMMAYQAGIRKGEKPGFTDFILAPVPGGHFTDVEAAYDSAQGTIKSAWTAEDGKLLTYDAVVPANTRATLYLPITEEKARAMGEIEGATFKGMQTCYGRQTAVFALTSGSYHFR